MRRQQRPVDIKVQPSGNEVLSVRFPTEMLNRIEEAAAAEGVTVSEYVRRPFTNPPRLSQVHLQPPTANPAAHNWLVRA
jgi:hypothetical protein